MNDGGLFELCNPARFLLITLATVETAFSCPMILLCKCFSKFNNFSVSASVIFLTGILVQSSITAAISASVNILGFNFLVKSSIFKLRLHSLVFKLAAFC